MTAVGTAVTLAWSWDTVVHSIEPAAARQGGAAPPAVQGHVDARGRFLSVANHAGSWTVRIEYPTEIARYLVFKGSIAVEGISLTIATLADNYFEVAIIPKTWEVTNFSQLQPGAEVNLEADVIAKYVERIMLFSEADGRKK